MYAWLTRRGKQETDAIQRHIYDPAICLKFVNAVQGISERSLSRRNIAPAHVLSPVWQLTSVALAVDGRAIGGRWQQTQHFGPEFFAHVVSEVTRCRLRCGTTVHSRRFQEPSHDVWKQLHKSEATSTGGFAPSEPGSMLLTDETRFRVTPPSQWREFLKGTGTRCLGRSRKKWNKQRYRKKTQHATCIQSDTFSFSFNCHSVKITKISTQRNGLHLTKKCIQIKL